MNCRISQQDIANRLQLDKSTVSLALRNSPRIAKETRQKVAQMAKQLGYRPEPALEFLAKQRWKLNKSGSGIALAYVIDSRQANQPLNLRFLRAATARAEERGYLLHCFDVSSYRSLNSATRVLFSRGIRGLLMPQFTFSLPQAELAPIMERFTVMGLDVGQSLLPFHSVTPDYFYSTRLVWENAVKRGYQRIGAAVLSHRPVAFDDATRFGASAASQEQWVDPANRVPLLTSHHEDRDSFCRWLDEHQPDAVLGFISRVYDWIISTGRKVPEDVSFASLAVSVNLTPHLSGARLPDDEIAAAGVDALISAMHANEWGVPATQRKLLIEPEWHEGGTLPPAVLS